MATIVYLDIEDEITTAAARIRTADAPRVAMVVPFGSRVATSRINFRLLAREAHDAGRRLDVVAPDASSRALAASAGRSVFASVAEYEAAVAMGDVAAPEAVAEPPFTPPTGRGLRDGPSAPPRADARAADPRAADLRAPRGRPAMASKAADALVADRASIGAPSRSAAAAASLPRDVPVDASRRRRGSRGPVMVVVLVLALALGFGGAAAAVALPSAQITVTPMLDAVPPVSLTVRADTTATAVDQAGLVIPATSLEVPLTTSGEFAASGTSVQQTSAQGRVTFDSTNTVNAFWQRLQAARQAGLDFIINCGMDLRQRVAFVVDGDLVEAHRRR